MLRCAFIVLTMLIFCAACTSETLSSQLYPTATRTPASILTIAQAQQADAPALAMSSGQWVAAWIGADDRGVHQDARRLTDQDLSPTVTLPLPPTHPYGQQLFPGDSGSTHLLWLDADETGNTNLYSALLASDLTVERGPVSVSEGLALNFSAVPDDAGGLWTVWSGGLLAETTLYLRRIDAAGRPLLDKIATASNADDPALVETTDGQVWLFWLAGGQLMRQRIDQADTSAQALTGAVNLAAGDRLINVSAALDASTAYFFWNITRSNGVNETWWTAGSLVADTWRQPVRFTNTAGVALRWTVPLAGQNQTQRAAVESAAGLGIVSLRDGAVVDYKTVRPGERLIGLPSLAEDAAGNLNLAWSAPGDTNANLQLITLENIEKKTVGARPLKHVLRVAAGLSTIERGLWRRWVARTCIETTACQPCFSTPKMGTFVWTNVTWQNRFWPYHEGCGGAQSLPSPFLPSSSTCNGRVEGSNAGREPRSRAGRKSR